MTATSDWLRTGKDIPSGGVSHEVTYRTGSGSSAVHLKVLGSVLGEIFGAAVFAGSVNLWADEPIVFLSPAVVDAGGSQWLMVPVVISEKSVGIAARRTPPEETRFIEVFAAEQLVPKLGLQPNDRTTLRILDHSHLGLASSAGH